MAALPHRSTREHPGVGAAAPWCLWLAGLATAFHPAILSGFTSLQLERGDPRLIAYLLEHSWRFVLRRPLHASLWDPPFFHPVAGTGAFTDTLVGAVLPYGLARLFGAPAETAFQLWSMASLSLAFLATYLLLARGLGLARWPAATGAFLTGFGAPRLANFHSPQLFTLYWGVLALAALGAALRAVGGPRTRRAPLWAAAAACLLVLQAWSAFYPTFFFALALAVAAAIAAALPGCREPLLTLLRRHPVAVAAVAAGAALAVLPLLRAHLAAASTVGLRSWEIVREHLPPPGSWLYTGERAWLYERIGIALPFTPPAAQSQFANGVGLATTVAAVAGLALGWRRPAVRVVALTTLALIALVTVWPGGGSLWTAVWQLAPGARAIRYPARLGMLLTITASVGLGLLLDRTRHLRRGLVALAIGAVCLLEQPKVLRGRDPEPYRDAVTALAREARAAAPTAQPSSGCDAFYLALAEPAGSERERATWTHLAAMWVSLETGLPTVNGYAGNEPPGWAPLRAAGHEGEGDAELERRLGRWQAQHPGGGSACLVTAPRERMPWYEPPRRRRER